MGLNATPSGERLHIGFFGCRNAGKSSVVNAVTGQNLAIVSDVKGTTTDPVYKAMELLPLGPVMIIDTPGIDDEGELGLQRVQKTRQVLNKTDIAILVVDSVKQLTTADHTLITLFEEKQIPYLVAYNKSDLADAALQNNHAIRVSAKTGDGIHTLKERIGQLSQTDSTPKHLVGDLLTANDIVVLVTPIDESAPKGRLILPQQQTIRDILDADAVSIVTKETALKETLRSLGKPPKLVITDSQAFKLVADITPKEVPLTSFSILMARYKGFLESAVRGAAAISRLRDGDTVLISEGCTHHRQCNDIGTVKLPNWLKQYTGKELRIATSSGTEFPEDLSPYQLIIHCGGCMLNEREMTYRMKCAGDAGIPMTNYGTAIAQINGILARSVECFPHIRALLD